MAEKKPPQELTLAGALIGMAAVIPGVSSGTMALITGAYDAIIEVIEALVRTVQKRYWDNPTFPWGALAKLFVGGVLGVGIAAILITYLLTNMPGILAAAFSGLIITSSFMLLADEKKFHAKQFYAGALVALVIALVPVLHVWNNSITVFILGLLAGAASILPGLSGSGIILIFGFYPQFATALTHPVSQIEFLFPLLIGGILGFGASIHFIKGLLARQHGKATNFFVGMALGGIALLVPAIKLTTGVDVFAVIIALVAGLASGLVVAKR